MARNRRTRNRRSRRRKRQGQPTNNRKSDCHRHDDDDDHRHNDDDDDDHKEEEEESQLLLTPPSTTTTATTTTETNANANDDGDGDTCSSSSSKSSSEANPPQPQKPQPQKPQPQPQKQQQLLSNFQQKLSSELNRDVFTLREFIKHHAPDFVFDGNRGNNDNGNDNHSHSHTSSCNSWPPELGTMSISPLSTIPSLTHLRRAECHEPVSSLIDDVVWSLVQRQERGKRRFRQRQKQQKFGGRHQQQPLATTARSGLPDNTTKAQQQEEEEACFRNVLIQGYTTASEGETTPRGMRPGVALISRRTTTITTTTTLTTPTATASSFPRQRQRRLAISSFPINENLAYCKSSSVIQFLHSMVGDVMMRMMLLHTRIFLPLLPSTVAFPAAMDSHHHQHHKSNSTTNRADDSNDSQPHGQKYLLLCGPPLPPVSTKTNPSPDSNVEVSHGVGSKRKNDDCVSLDTDKKQAHRPRKRKKRHRYQSTQEIKDTNGSISRFPLLYFDAYVPKIGLPKSHILQRIRQRQLDRRRIRNSTGTRSKPPSFPGLSTNAKQKSDHDLLFNTMLGLWRLNKNKQRRIRKRMGPDCIKLCKTILHGHSKCDYHRLLERHCPLPPAAAKCRRLDSTIEISSSKNDRLMQLAHAYTCKDGIVVFLRRVLQQVFPIESFWGSSGNFDSFMVSVENFVHLRRRELLTNKCLMHGIRVTKMKWLMTNKDRSANTQTLRTSHGTLTNLSLTVLRWVFQGFIIPLLRSIFYVTETEFSGQELQYYRKPVWSLFRSVSIKKLVKASHFQGLSFSKTLAQLRNHNQIGLSRLRLLPKTTGLRPINQLSLRQSLRFLFASSPAQISNSGKPNLSQTEISPRLPANIILRKVLDVLRYESSHLENPFGVGMDSLEMFYSQYRDYVTKMRLKFGSDINLFAASVDIEKCYDRMNQGVLLSQLNDLVSNASYVIQQIRLNHFVGDSQRKYSYSELEHGGRKSHLSRVVAPMDTYQPLHESQHAVGNPRDKIFEMSKCIMIEQAEILELLKEHLTSQMVVVSGRFQRKVLLQRTGIAQGSVLSTMLCNLYYGNVEKLMFSERPTGSGDRMTSNQSLGHGPTSDNKDDKDALMARFVDDFLFLSPRKESVGKFLAKAHEGVPRLGAEVNQEKSMVSADLPLHGEAPSAGRTKVSSAPIHIRRNRQQHPVFPWCGLLFDLTTGEVSMDYERFRGGRLRDSLTVESNGSEGLRLNSRMKSFAQPRCLPILFDAVINSPTTIAVNFYEMIAISAAKTVEYLRSHSKLVAGSRQNPSFVWTCIEELGTYVWQNIDRNLRRLRSKDVPKQGKRWGHGFHLRQEQSNWLTWKAFYDVFSSTDDFDDLAQMLSNKEPKCHPSSYDLTLNHVAASTFENFQLKHFIDLENAFSRNTKS